MSESGELSVLAQAVNEAHWLMFLEASCKAYREAKESGDRTKQAVYWAAVCERLDALEKMR